MLDTEFQFYLSHQDKLVKKYNGKHIVIVGTNVVGAYDSLKEAYFRSEEFYEPGTFFIQKCTSGEESYTLHFRNQLF
ncbi:MAG: DUF5678 domain-containing protein [Bacteroidales bacterium]|nr:DUF5678 domain-containing protein [Bacteroidales bacterium]